MMHGRKECKSNIIGMDELKERLLVEVRTWSKDYYRLLELDSLRIVGSGLIPSV